MSSRGAARMGWICTTPSRAWTTMASGGTNIARARECIRSYLEAFLVVTYSGSRRWEEALVDPTTLRPGYWARLRHELESDYRANLKEWSSVPAIRAEVERLAASFGPHAVGVHIRCGDSWDHHRLGWEYRRSSGVAFIAHMDAELVSEPRTNLFLATDCA